MLSVGFSIQRVWLFLEQVFESLASVIGTGGGWGRGLFFHHDADGIERAFVVLVFAGDAFGDGLHALKTARWIEVSTLLAGVEFESAFGASTDRVAN
jgi:hypothetical protein